MMDGGMMAAMGIWAFLLIVTLLAVLVLSVLGSVWLVRRLRQDVGGSPVSRSGDSAHDTLRRRHAAGEIDDDEYKRRLAALSRQGAGTGQRGATSGRRTEPRKEMTMPASAEQRQRWRRYWDRNSRGYDRQMRLLDRVLFGDTRHWVCSQATGRVLEVAIGTGLNLEHYRNDIALTGIDLSPAMLELARRRARDLGRAVDLYRGDAEALEFPDASFDSVVCTFSLCAIPEHRRAVAEMVRVLRPGGTLLLADHVAAPHPALRAVQRIVELVSVPLGGEHLRRRPIELVRAAGLRVERHDRFAAGIVERLTARVPDAPIS